MNQSCTQCHKTFLITADDLEFYTKITVPQPKLCPSCRMQQRLSWRNESTLYNRQCDLCKRAMISIYSADKPYQVYCQDCFWSDQWDPLEYGRSYKSKESFFQQYHELLQVVPRLGIINKQSENSDYCNYSFANKNCYLTFGNHYEEGCLYGRYSTKNRDCMDYMTLYECELCYECTYSKNCYQSIYIDHCSACYQCYFSTDLKGCKNCMFSSNLHNKQFYIFNQSYSEAEYFNELEKLELHTQAGLQRALETFRNEVLSKQPRRAYYQIRCERCDGNNHTNSNNLSQCFDCTNCENCVYGYQMDETYDSMDMNCMGYDKSELCYQTVGCSGLYNGLFCDSCWDASNLTYCNLCFSSKNLFGCVSIQKQEFCVLNTRYSAEEYENLIKQIRADMQSAGEWGQFFPMTDSPFSYNETVASEHIELDKAQVIKQGWQWKDEEVTKGHSASTGNTCASCTRAFKIVEPEQALYKKIGVPESRYCPQCRHVDRITRRNPFSLWHRQCMCTQIDHQHEGRCSIEFETTYSPERKELVYCENCYQKEIN